MSDSDAPRHDGRLTTAMAAVALVVLVAGIVTAVVGRGGDSGASARRVPTTTADTTAAAESAATAYYTAVRENDARTAYGLLCRRDRTGYPAYAAEVSKNRSTGTGVRSYQAVGQGRILGVEAAVPATIVLDDGVQTPIVVLLVREAGAWRVCSSNLGGILPPPGPTSSVRPSPANPSTPAGVPA